jgi:Outer membrane protein beta-barrel domain
MRRCIHKRLVTIVGVVSLIAVPLAGSAAAEERPDPVIELAAGWVGFADDGVVNEGLVGGSARFYLSPRISVGLEVAYISGQDHSHLMLTGNLTWDVLPPAGRRLRRVNPFVVVGGGLFQTREEFFNGPFTSYDGAFTAGGGVRALVGDRVTVGVDARIGWELHLRVSGLLGVQLGR